MKLELRRLAIGILLRMKLGLRMGLGLLLVVVVMVVMMMVPLMLRWRLWRLRARILHIVEIGIVLALQHQVLLPVLLLDGGQRVDVLLEPLARRLLLRGMRQPRAEVLDQLVVRHPPVRLRQHILPHRLQRELGRARHLSSLFFVSFTTYFTLCQN